MSADQRTAGDAVAGARLDDGARRADDAGRERHESYGHVDVTTSIRSDRRRRQRWLVASGVALALVLLAMLPPFLGKERGLLPRLVYFSVEVPILVAALSLYYERAERRQSPGRRTLAISAGIAVAIGAVSTTIFSLVLQHFDITFDARGERPTLPSMLTFGFFMSLLQAAFWALGFAFPYAAEGARLRALEAERLRLESDKLKLEADKLKLEAEQLRTAAELAALRSRLEPHFLLNTLNAIAGLVTKRPQEARRLLGCLGDLLRDSLREPTELQTLDEEIAWLRRYAEILESRHGDALRFHWEITDASRALLVPRLLLQPLVENAVNHGALRRDGEGQVTVRIQLEETPGAHPRVLCTIEDNGPGLPQGELRAGAFGLHSVRRRLALKYNGDASLRLESTAEGTRAVVRLPRPAPEQPSAAAEAQ